MHELGDHVECMVSVHPQTDQGEIGVLALGSLGDVGHLKLTGYRLVSELCHDSGDPREPVLALVCDQDSQRMGLVVSHHGACVTEVGS